MKRLSAILSLSIGLLLLSTALQAINPLPQGKWKVSQVTIEKNTDGNTETTAYKEVEKIRSYFTPFKSWEINEKNIVINCLKDRKETANYAIEGNQLKVMTAFASQLYQYNVNGENLILTTTYNYVNNLPTGQTERIEEKWTINLKKQQ